MCHHLFGTWFSVGPVPWSTMILRHPTYRWYWMWHQQDLPLLRWQMNYLPQEPHWHQGGSRKVGSLAAACQRTDGREVVVPSLSAREIWDPYQYVSTLKGWIEYQCQSWNIHEPSNEGKSSPGCFALRFLRRRRRRLQGHDQCFSARVNLGATMRLTTMAPGKPDFFDIGWMKSPASILCLPGSPTLVKPQTSLLLTLLTLSPFETKF